MLNFLANILHGRVSACGDHNAGTLILHLSVFWVDPVICSMICLVTANCCSCSIAPLFSSWKRVLVWWNSECCWADIAYWYHTSWTLFSLFSLSWLLVSPVLIFFFWFDYREWCFRMMLLGWCLWFFMEYQDFCLVVSIMSFFYLWTLRTYLCFNNVILQIFFVAMLLKWSVFWGVLGLLLVCL